MLNSCDCIAISLTDKDRRTAIRFFLLHYVPTPAPRDLALLISARKDV